MKEKVVRQYFGLMTLFYMSMLMTGGIYATYLGEHGMSLLHVSLINSVFFITLFVCEIPTGAFADTYGRKPAIVLACILRGTGSIIYGLSDTLGGFLLAEAIAALGTTFLNGALNAWLTDSLLHRGYDKSVVNTRLFASGLIFGQIAGGLASPLGSYLGSYSMRFPWLLQGLIGIGTGYLAYRILTEDYFVKVTVSGKKGLRRMMEVAVKSLQYARTDKAVRFILVMNFTQLFAVQTFNMNWQPFFEEKGVEKIHFGTIFFFVQIGLACGGFYAMIVKTGDREKITLIGSQIIVGVLIVLAAIMPNWKLALAFFLLHQIGRGMWKPLVASYLHKRIPSHERATIDSFCQISPHIGGAFGLVASGLTAHYVSIPFSWIFSGIVLVGCSVLIARNSKGE